MHACIYPILRHYTTLHYTARGDSECAIVTHSACLEACLQAGRQAANFSGPPCLAYSEDGLPLPLPFPDAALVAGSGGGGTVVVTISPVNTSMVATALVLRSSSSKFTSDPRFGRPAPAPAPTAVGARPSLSLSTPTVVPPIRMPANRNIDFRMYVVSSGFVIQMQGQVCRAA